MSQPPDTTGGYLLTHHARERMTEMKVSVLELVAVLTRPQVIYPRIDGKWTYQGKVISLGVATDEESGLPIIVTVVYRLDEDWQKHYAGGRR